MKGVLPVLNRAVWQNPSAEYRIHPFWFWNGEMDDAEIVKQIGEMADKGIGGFFICARQGLQVPYLSATWFRKVKLAVITAKEKGMHVWLYDEYPYPSGIAGGEVTLELPECKQYTLEHCMQAANGGEVVRINLPWARVLFAKAVPVDKTMGRMWNRATDLRECIGNWQAENVFQKSGLTSYNEKRFFTYGPVKRLVWQAPNGQWEIHVFLEKEIADFKYYGTYVDPCRREATEAFIRLTHERYKRELGEFFGGTIKGVFTDETGLLGRIPWSPALAESFLERNGYDLREHLYALLVADGENTPQIRYDYFQTIHHLLRENYHKPIHDWCAANGLQYVAEVPSVRMTTQLHSHIPGGDSAHEKIGRPLAWILDRYAASIRSNPRMVSSLARQLGSSRALIECFHSVGWSMTLQDAKWMIDRLASLGINFFNFHAFFYTLNGLTKYDAPPSQFLQNSYWPHFRLLGDYVGRISYALSQGDEERPLAVLAPITSLWTHMGNPLQDFHYMGENEAEQNRLQAMLKDWTELTKWLDLHRYGYDHLDPELLATAQVAKGRIFLGKACYSVLLLPPLANLEGAAWDKIKAFIAGGGTVIAIGSLPYERIEAGRNTGDEIRRMFGLSAQDDCGYWQQEDIVSSAPSGGTSGEGKRNAHFIPCRNGRFATDASNKLHKLLDSLPLRKASVLVDGDSDSLLLQHRRLPDGGSLVFLSNQENREISGWLKLAGKNTDFTGFFKLNPETGAAASLAAGYRDGQWMIPVRLAPYESCLLETDTAPSQKRAVVKETAWALLLDPSGNWRIELPQENIARLEQYRLYLPNADRAFPIMPKTFIDQCADLAECQTFPLRFRQMFGTPIRIALAYPLQVRYETEFTVQHMPNTCSLLMDRGAVAGKSAIYLNGKLLSWKDAKTRFVYDQHNVVMNIRPLLMPGMNRLTLKVEIGRDDHGLLEPFYLMGDFGVEFAEHAANPVIVAMPEQGAPVGDESAGYPHYPGVVAYRRSFTLDRLPREPLFDLRFAKGDEVLHDTLEVRINGQPLGVRAWTPYCWRGDSSILREGENMLEVRVARSLCGLLEGKKFDYDAHALTKPGN
ncbi:MAG TPA: glycosyl hydrolase [Bacilli bacterium]